MSLREEWDAARAQRQQEINERQHQVLEHRHQTQMELYETATNRAAMAAALRDSLSNFHNTLQSDVANFREETRLHQQEVWMEEAHQRAAYVAAMRDYVWGTAPTLMTDVNPVPLPAPNVPPSAKPKSIPTNLERVFQYVRQNIGVQIDDIETALGLSRADTVNALQSLMNQKLLVQQAQSYYPIQGS
ncbi:hypothetical protein H6S82_04890 [Planktothrix sp. FACHB-1355]|uniref:Uncharacterized protein n=1 Tax=Aerosakkonema funiforme FACHB-1375 TaxID=2949571 RepID=A0A926ZH99_9CYAN|nr:MULTISPECIES: hypothetical protein [Oscillatoriales]MBD2181957.1 hypothetical protein [Aerosakkonema funiforme FACHB-1375]MBD3558191.1 hypothetical protein [Planktothrix sp. FACHB-1355]